MKKYYDNKQPRIATLSRTGSKAEAWSIRVKLYANLGCCLNNFQIGVSFTSTNPLPNYTENNQTTIIKLTVSQSLRNQLDLLHFFFPHTCQDLEYNHQP